MDNIGKKPNLLMEAHPTKLETWEWKLQKSIDSMNNSFIQLLTFYNNSVIL